MNTQVKDKTNAVIKRKEQNKITEFLWNNIVWILLLGAIVVMGLINPIFFTYRIINNIFVQGSILGVLAAAIAFSLLIGEIDLSIVGISAISACVGTLWMKAGLPWPLAALFMVIFGAVIGLFNGLLIAKLKAVSLIETLAVQITLLGAVLAITKGRSIINFPDGYKLLGQGRIGGMNGFPIVIIAFLLVFFIVHIIWSKTPFGRSLFAVGGNADSAKVSGIKVDEIRIKAFVVSGTLAGFAGYMLSSYMGAVTNTFGTSYIMYSVAAAVIGGVSLTGGRGNIMGVLGGTLLLTVMQVGLQLLGISSYYVEMAGGIMIFVAVIIDALRLKIQN